METFQDDTFITTSGVKAVEYQAFTKDRKKKAQTKQVSYINDYSQIMQDNY